MGCLERSLWSQMSKVKAIYLFVSLFHIYTLSCCNTFLLVNTFLHLLFMRLAERDPRVQCLCSYFMGSLFLGHRPATAMTDAYSV